MQNVHILKYILPTFGIVMFAMFFDSNIVNYLPYMSPIQVFKGFKQSGHLIKNFVIYIIKWYGLWVFAWFAFHFLLLKKFIHSIKCHKIDENNLNNLQSIPEYEGIPITQDNHSKNSIQTKQISKSTVLDLQQQLKSRSFFQSVVYPYLMTFIFIFIIVFLTITLVQSQISIISHQFKNGSHHSKWMGARQYYTLDFFHNIPPQYQQNHKLMDLFDQQDKSVSATTNWIANYKLFFGLFYLMLKTLSPFGIVMCFILVFLKCKITLNENKIKKRDKIKSIVKHSSQMGLFNIIFVLFLGFSLLSAIFLQLKTKNNVELCTLQKPVGGFLLSLSKGIQTEIISQTMKIHPSLDESAQTFNKHQILFVFQNLCQVIFNHIETKIFTPYYHKVVHSEEIFLFSMRVSEIFFGFSILLLIYSKYTQNQSIKLL